MEQNVHKKTGLWAVIYGSCVEINGSNSAFESVDCEYTDILYL